MHIVALEPGFDDTHSHHATVNENLNKFFNKNNSNTYTALANIKLSCDTTDETDLNQSIPFFSSPCYTNRLKPLDRNKEQSLAENFAAELSSAFERNFIRPQSCVLMHTFFSFHILGLAIWLQKMNGKFAGSLILCGMFYPGHELPKGMEGIEDSSRYLRYKLAFALLGKSISHQRWLLASSCNEFVESYKRVSNRKVLLHPAINIAHDFSCPTKHEKNEYRVLLYVGSVKEEKGLRFILNSCERLLSSFPKHQFVIHLNSYSCGIRDFADAESNLIEIAASYDNLTLFTGSISNHTYHKLLNSCNAVVFNYDNLAYENKTSGVLWDVLARKTIKMICTAGTWLEREHRRAGGSPFVFDCNDLSSLTSALKASAECSDSLFAVNDYYENVLQSFPKWVETQHLNLQNAKRHG